MKMVAHDKDHLLIESYYAPANMCKKVSNDPEYKNLKESLDKDWISTNHSKLSESTKSKLNSKSLLESAGEEVILAAKKELREAGLKEPDLWMFPISRVNDYQHKNLNGRIYDINLWNKVINEQTDTWKYGTGLANHPQGESEPDFLAQSIIWYGAKILEGIVYGVGAFLDSEGGRLAEDIIRKKGRIGFSTAGFGDVLEEGYVDPETYEIERLADMVMCPSQGVFGDYKDAYNPQSVRESIEENMKRKAIKEEEEKVEDQNTETTSTEETPAEDQNAESQDTNAEEGEVETEEDTLSESLLKEHYLNAVKEAKDGNISWRTKIATLDNLSKSIRKESVKESIKNVILEKIEEAGNAVMAQVDKIIPLGYQAKQLMDTLGIKNLKVLENTNKDLDDLIAVQEELETSNKTITRLEKNLAVSEGKVDKFAKEAYVYEQRLNKAIARAEQAEKSSELAEKKLTKAERDAKHYKKLYNEAVASNERLSNLLEETSRTNELLASRNTNNVKAMSKIRADRDRMIAENEAFEDRITNMNPMSDPVYDDEEDYIGSDYLNAYDDYDEYEEDEFFNEDTVDVIEESSRKERRMERKASMNNGIQSLADMFGR